MWGSRRFPQEESVGCWSSEICRWKNNFSLHQFAWQNRHTSDRILKVIKSSRMIHWIIRRLCSFECSRKTQYPNAVCRACSLCISYSMVRLWRSSKTFAGNEASLLKPRSLHAHIQTASQFIPANAAQWGYLQVHISPTAWEFSSLVGRKLKHSALDMHTLACTHKNWIFLDPSNAFAGRFTRRLSYRSL